MINYRGPENALDSTPGKRTGFLAFLLRIAIGISVLVFLLSTISLSDISRAFANAESAPLIIGSLLVIPHIGLQVFKWLWLMKTVNANARWSEASSSLIFSIAVGSFTPGRIGEIPGRSLLVSSLSPAQSISLGLLDKLQFFLLLILVGGPCVAIVMLSPSFSRSIIMATALVGPLILFFRTDLLSRLPHFLPNRWHGSWVREYEQTIGLLTIAQLSQAFVLTVASFAVLSLQVFFFLNAFTAVPFVDSFLGFSAMMAAKSVFPVSIADIGIREAGSVYFFARLGVSSAASFNAAVVLFLTNILLPSAIGLLFLPKASLIRRRNMAQSDAGVKRVVP
ncbi:MAG: lysylphosphatidylglycerol synthase transmembrane domain-containing protein [Bacteroidota bacterium]